MEQTLADLARRITAAERAHEMQQGSRRLGQTAIGGGGLRIYGGGSLTIDDGGSLVIIDGDLHLAAGSIDGDFLDTQVTTTYHSANRTDYGSTSWGTGATVTITPPEWATRTVVTISATADFKTRAEGRINVAGTRSIATEAIEWRSGYDDRYTQAIAWGGAMEGSSTVEVIYEFRELGLGWPTGTSGNRTVLAVAATHFR